RYCEMENYEAERDDLPAGVNPASKETNFHRQIAGPNDEQLRKAEICPQQNEGERQLTVIVDLLRLQHPGHGFVAHQNAFDDDHHANAGEALPDDEDETEDGRVPVWIDRHDPI